VGRSGTRGLLGSSGWCFWRRVGGGKEGSANHLRAVLLIVDASHQMGYLDLLVAHLRLHTDEKVLTHPAKDAPK